MMLLDPQNKIIYTSTIDLLRKQQTRVVISKDYNDFTSFLEFKDGKLSLSFFAFNYKETFEVAGDYCLKKYYQAYEILPSKAPFNITLVFDSQNLAKAPAKPDKKAPQEELDAYSKANAEYKAQNDAIIERVAKDFSSFKRNFYASVYEKAFDAINSGAPLAPYKYSARPNEVVLIVSDAKSVTIFYEVNFQDLADRTIGSIIITELQEAQRHTKNAVSVSTTKFDTEIITKNFPEFAKIKKDDKSIVVTFTLFQQQHFLKQYENQASLLQAFRQYLHYHIHASKTYLHSQLVKRINSFNRSLAETRFEKDDDKKIAPEEQAGSVWKK